MIAADLVGIRNKIRKIFVHANAELKRIFVRGAAALKQWFEFGLKRRDLLQVVFDFKVMRLAGR